MLRINDVAPNGANDVALRENLCYNKYQKIIIIVKEKG